MNCNTLKKNNGYACGTHCELFKSESGNKIEVKNDLLGRLEEVI